MAETMVAPPPIIAGAEAFNWVPDGCNLQLSSSIRALTLGGRRRHPVIRFYSDLHVHGFLQDGRRWTYELVRSPVSECDASYLQSPDGVVEAVLVDVIGDFMRRTGLPYRAFRWATLPMLLYLDDVAKWVRRSRAAPSFTHVHAVIHVSVLIVEGEETVGDGFGAPLPTEAAAVDDQPVRGAIREGTGCGAEEEEGEKECCAICLERLAGKKKERRWLACFHCFHGDCLGRWLRQKAECPLCRYQVK